MLEQPVKTKGSSSIRFPVWEFYSVHKSMKNKRKKHSEIKKERKRKKKKERK